MGLFRETLDKPGAVAIRTGRTYFVNAELESAFFEPNTISGRRKILVFPFNPPERWSYSYEYPTNGGTGKSRDDFDVRVAGWEQVTVPAGTFWAIKIEQQGWRNNLSADLSSYFRAATRLEYTFWYSPVTNSMVKTVSKSFGRYSGSALADVMINEQLVRFASAESKGAAGTSASK